jgi:hypothetical protein
MRVAALILGIVGGVFGIISGLLALGLGGFGSAFGAQGASTIVGLGWSALVFCFVGFLGAGLAMARPKFGGLLLLVAAVGFTISISWFAIVSGPLFFIAAIFAFFARVSRRKGYAVAQGDLSDLPSESTTLQLVDARGSFLRLGSNKVLLGIGGLVVIILVAIIASVGGGSRATVQSSSPSQTAIAATINSASTPVWEVQPAASPTANPKIAADVAGLRKIGDVVTAGNWAYQVIKTDQQRTVQWSPFGNMSDAKGIWQIVHIKIQNIGKETYPINAWDFEIKDDAGVTYKSAWTDSVNYSAYNKLSKPSDQYPPGVAVVMGILFDVNPQGQGLKLNLVQAKQMIDLDQKPLITFDRAMGTTTSEPQATVISPVVLPSTNLQLQGNTPPPQSTATPIIGQLNIPQPLPARPVVSPIPPTRTPPATAKPTIVQTPTPVPWPIKKDVNIEQEVDGLKITVYRVAVAPLQLAYQGAKNATDQEKYAKEGVTTVGTLWVKVENKSDKEIIIFPNQGDVVVGNEQVRIDMFASDQVGGTMFGTVHPGVLVDGAAVFMLKRSSWSDVKTIKYVFTAPSSFIKKITFNIGVQ